MSWEIILVEEVHEWYVALLTTDQISAALVAAALNVLEQEGSVLGRPLVDKIKGSQFHHLKELRPGSSGASEIRILFAFDPDRRAVLLVAGDKSGDWTRWYERSVPIAEDRLMRWIAGDYEEGIGG